MRLRAMRLGDERFTGGSVVLEFGGLSALWGPNDAGKTTVLLRVHDVLAWLTGRAPNLVEDAVAVSDVVVELSHTEAERLAADAALVLEEKSPQQLYVGSGIASVSMAIATPERDALAEALRREEPKLPMWIDYCLSHSGLDATLRSSLRDELVRTPRLKLSSRGGGARDWTGYWAIDSAAMHELELRPPDESRWIGMVQAHPAPISSAALPTPVAAGPDAWQPLADRLGACIAALVECVAAEAGDDARAGTVGRQLLIVVAKAVRRRMPEFIPDRYRLEVVADEATRALELVIHDRSGGSFSPGRLAEGYQLWVQLALADVLEQIETLRDALEHAYEEDAAHAPAHLVAAVLADPTAGAPEVEAAVNALWTLERTWAATRHTDQEASWVADPLQAALGRTPRIYTIDEPERHLHPALQRQAADWMRVMASEEAVQFLFTSHAPAMLGVPGDVSLTHVRRADRGIELRSLDPRGLRATDVEIRELGLDRGELLAFYRAVLFVEGETDRVVLEELYPEKLRNIGLLVQPFRGANKVEKIVEAETLLRVMGPPFHVLVDNLSAEELDAILALDLAAIAEALESKPVRLSGELAFVARIRRAALAEGRDVRVHSISAKDILGVLDQDCILEVQRQLRPDGPRWPGFARLVAEGEENYNRRLAKYGIDKAPEPFRMFARAMRERGRTSRELDAVLEAIWRATNEL